MQLNPYITTEQRYWWRIALELRLRKASSDAFQDFFSTVMERVHGSDFVRVRAYGALGDKGCDGYLASTGQLFQCYGATQGELKVVATLTTKINTDFATALTKLSAIMKSWHFVHNLADGMPVDGLLAIKDLETKNPTINFGMVGPDGFVELIFSLPVTKIEDLLGPAASDFDAKNLDVNALRKLIHELAAASDAVTFDTGDLRPVPPDKLEYNKLPNHWKQLIASGWQTSHLVAEYFRNHHDPLAGDQAATLFRNRYNDLRAQHLSAGDTMAALYELVTGVGNVLPQQQVAAQALLAFLFENCDIFERNPDLVVS